MEFNNFEEYFSSNLKFNDDQIFQEKLQSLLNDNNKNKIDLIKKEKEEKEKLLKKRLKDESNERKIDFILSDENSFEQFKIKNNDIKTIREENEDNIDDIIFNDIKNGNNNYNNNINSNISNTNNLINNEKDKNDIELIQLGEDIKNNNPLLYNWQKIKKYKEVKDLQTGLEKDEIEKEKEIIIKSDKQNKTNNINASVNASNKKNQKKNFIKDNNNINNNTNNNINITKKSQKNLNIKNKDNLKNNKKQDNKKEKEKEKGKENYLNNQINNKEDDDEDLIMSIIQHPVQACQKTKNHKPKMIRNNLLSNNEKNENSEKNENIENNYYNDNNIFLQENNSINKYENESLLNIFKKEKEIKNKLQKILQNNPSVSQNDFFSNDYTKDNFYNYNSNSKFLSMAKEILINKLTPGEKNYLMELDQEINRVKQQITDAINEKNKYSILVNERKKEYQNFEVKKNKVEFEFERDLINDLRSIINQFKLEIYKKELELNKKNNNDTEDNKEEIEKLKKEHKLIKNKLDSINKNNEKNIIEIQKKIMIKKYENEKMKEKIDLYEKDQKFEKLDENLPVDEAKNILNKNNKKEKIKFVEDDDDNDIIINNNYVVSNIIKTSSKSNHLNELDFEFPDKYFDESNVDNNIVKHQFELDGKVIKIFNSGKKEIIFPNSTKKEIFPGGYTLVTYSNGDIKETIPHFKEIYYYKQDEVNQIVFADGCKYIKYLKTGKIICNGTPIN